MKRDVMETAGLEMFAEIAIVIFFVTFTIIVIRALLMRKSKIEHAKNLPLDEGEEVES